MNNKNYRVMKFFEPVNKKDKSRGYVRLDMRGNRGNLIVAAENLGDARSTSEVYLYKDKQNKIKLGDINNKKGIIKKLLTFGNTNAIEDYNVCAVVKDGKIVLYSSLFNAAGPNTIRKLEEDDVDIVELESDGLSTKAEKERKEEQQNAKKEQKDTKGQTTEAKEKITEPKGFGETTKIKQEQENNDINDNIKEAKEKPIAGTEQKEEAVVEIIKPIRISIKESIKEESKAPVKEADDIKDENSETIVEKSNLGDKLTQGSRFRNRFDENLYNMLGAYKSVEPLSVRLKNFKWWYIPYDEVGAKSGVLPYYNQIISSYYPYPMSSRVTTCASLMKKYGHYIFGTYEENDEIVKFIYGIPGEFTKEEQPYKGVTGFKNWSYGSKDNKRDSGYWLAFVNPKTGETTDPPAVTLI